MQEVDESVTAMEGVTQKNAALVEESTASVNSVDRQMEQLSRVVRYLRTGADAASEPRPEARVLQEGLNQRLGVETAAETTVRTQAEHAPAKRAAGSRLSEFLNRAMASCVPRGAARSALGNSEMRSPEQI